MEQEKDEPMVVAIMLARSPDRAAMAARAVQAFKLQSYRNCRLLVWDTGEKGFTRFSRWPTVFHAYPSPDNGRAIGALRNEAVNAAHCLNAEIIVHWDDDDWSYPGRIADQVHFLQSSGADIVGYNDMLFWKQQPESAGETWAYRSDIITYCVGTSLCYWLQTWQSRPFDPSKPAGRGAEGEDTVFCRGRRTAAVTSFQYPGPPRMVCSIHPGNTSDYSQGHLDRATEWKRAPEHDAVCKKIMEGQ